MTEKADAQTERALAAHERDVAAADRHDAGEERRASREDVHNLATEVGHLGASVADLHDLILDSLIKSETAITEAGSAAAVAKKAPSKKRVYLVSGLVIAVTLVIAGAGAYSVNEVHDTSVAFRQSQYEQCLKRNDEQEESERNLAAFGVAIDIAAQKGDPLALELQKLLAVSADPPQDPVDCERIRP